MKVLIVLHHRFELWNAPAWFVEKLRADFPQVKFVHLPTYENVEEQLPDAEVVIAWSIRPDQFQTAKKLRWIHSPAAAVHQLMFPELVNSRVQVTNARNVHGPVVAEHVIALIFALAKKIPHAVKMQAKHVWAKGTMFQERPPTREVAGATVGLVGLGSIGREVAKRASALGMRVMATREHPEKGGSPGVERVFASKDLDQMIAESDYVVLAAPITSDTQGIMNAERFGKMKKEACLINVGRGPLLDNAALVEALRRKRIGGAALDVFDQEPLPQESPLWDLENLLITPHSAAITEKLWGRHYELIKENLRRYLAGEELLATVDKKRGY